MRLDVADKARGRVDKFHFGRVRNAPRRNEMRGGERAELLKVLNGMGVRMMSFTKVPRVALCVESAWGCGGTHHGSLFVDVHLACRARMMRYSPAYVAEVSESSS